MEIAARIEGTSSGDCWFFSGVKATVLPSFRRSRDSAGRFHSRGRLGHFLLLAIFQPVVEILPELPLFVLPFGPETGVEKIPQFFEEAFPAGQWFIAEDIFQKRDDLPHLLLGQIGPGPQFDGLLKRFRGQGMGGEHGHRKVSHLGQGKEIKTPDPHDIQHHQESLDKYIGEVFVAVFGSLIPLENSAEAAARAAIVMMKEMVRLNEKWQTRYDFTMELGIGINTGEVFLGNIGSPDRMEFTVIGDTVNTASRFSGLAQGRQILATRSARNHLGSVFEIRQHPSTMVKGKAEKVEVFEVVY